MANNEIRFGRKNHLFNLVNSIKPALKAGVFLGVFALGACSQVPDAVNPASWYKSTVDLFAGDKAEEKKEGRESALAADRGKAPPGSEKAFPNLASVDEKARRRDKTGGGLAADPDRPKYAPAIRRQGAPSDILGAPPVPAPQPPAVAATAPPPSAAPSAPVTTVPPALGQPPAPATQPPSMPKLELPTMTAEQRDDQDRLARQLAEIRSRAEAGSVLPANVQLSAAPGEQATIVISSQGIETVGAMAAETPLPTMTPPQPPAASRLMESRAVMAAPGRTVKVATILFDNGSSRLKAHDKRILRAVTRLQRKNGGKLRIVGHASSRTRNLPPIKHKMANFQVSASRADRVASALVSMGVKQEDIQIAAVSDAEPVYYEFMPSGEAGNRRTEVYLTN